MVSRKHIENMIETCERSVAFWQAIEDKARNEGKIDGHVVDRDILFRYLHRIKAHRKTAQGELQYWQWRLKEEEE